jgi:hypothetical protein
MRTAAGVLLIVVAVINLFASLFYFGVAGGPKLNAMVMEQARREGQEVPPASRRQAQVLEDAPRRLGTTAGALVSVGLFLLVTVGTSIAGAVCLFRQRAARFVIAAAALVVAAEGIDAVIIKFGWGNVPGLIAAVFAVLGARSIMVRPIDLGPPSPSAGAPT